MSAAVQDAARKAAVTTPSDREIRIERVFDAPRDRVWQAFTDPKLVAQWWGRGNELVVERMEVEKGGHWRFVEHGPEGVHGFEGRYREVTPTTRLVHTFEWDGMPAYVIIETVTFEDAGPGTNQGGQRQPVPHHRGAGRDARGRDGGRARPELRGAGPAARDDEVDVTTMSS
jgi:uncharacterized protein YndB with AHSA1/START domain